MRRASTHPAFRQALQRITSTFWVVALSGTVHAGTLGLPDNTARIGYAAGPAYVLIDEAHSAPNQAWSMSQSLIYTDWFLAGTRYWATLRYQQADFDAGVGKIGAHLTSYGGRLSVQHNFRVAKNFAPWLGAGIDLSQIHYSRRHTVDVDGYLVETFPSRTTLNTGLVVNATHEWSFGRAFHIDTQLEQLLSVNDTVRETTLWASLLYRY